MIDDLQPVATGELQAVFAQDLFDVMQVRDARDLEQLSDRGIGDLILALRIEILLVDGATGGEDQDGAGGGHGDRAAAAAYCGMTNAGFQPRRAWRARLRREYRCMGSSWENDLSDSATELPREERGIF